MKSRFILGLTAMVLLSGCYCKWVQRGYSSVRELKAIHDYKICPDNQTVEGSFLPITIYTGDPFYTHLKFQQNDTSYIISNINYNYNKILGIRGETFLKLGSYPGPLLGIGLDYSRNNFTAQYFTVMHQVHEQQTQKIQQQRLSLNLNLVTWLKTRMMGYISFQKGREWTKREIQSEFSQYNFEDKKSIRTKNWRIGYGFQFYFRPGLAFNLEFGYGGGAFVKTGICWWII